MPFNKTEALRRAEEHVSKREITAAIAIHRMIAQADPYDLTTINALGELYVSVGRTKEAIDDFTRIADSYLNSGSGIKAAYLLRKALDLDPSNASALIKLGEIYLREGMIEKAHDEFIRAGALLASEGQFTGALQANHRALTANPGSLQARAAIAALQADASETGFTGKPPETGTRGLRSPSELDPASAKLPDGTREPSTADEESLIQQLSKAEMLVGYGEVDRAITLLKDVVSQSPDNLDVHGKLKDIYLRNEMIKEAALECLELARIHEARGESARASEYTMRAGRLGQSSAHLINHQSSQPPVEVARLANIVPASSGYGEVLPETHEPKPPAQPQTHQEAPSASMTLPPEAVETPRLRYEAEPEPPVASAINFSSAEAPRPVHIEAEAQIRGASPTVWGPTHTPPQPYQEARAVPNPSVSHHKPVVAQPSANINLRVRETPFPAMRPSESSFEQVKAAVSSNSLSATDMIELQRGAVTARFTMGVRPLTAAAITVVAAMLLSVGALKAVSMYGAQLDHEYEELALSYSAAEKVAPPGLPTGRDLQPSGEAVQIDVPPVQVVTPSGPATEQPAPANNPRSGDLERPNAPTLIGEQPRTNKPAAMSPPMVAVTDQRGGESLVPRGLPTGAPMTFAPAPSPPPAAPTPQRSIPIIKGEAIRQAQPEYPSIARTARQEGTVPVEVSINENGDVISARATSGPALLRGPAESAARRWKFKPSTRDGKPLPTVTTINFRFKL